MNRPVTTVVASLLALLCSASVLRAEDTGGGGGGVGGGGGSGGSGGVLEPTRTYFAPGQPITVKVNAPGPVEVVLRDFIGRSTLVRTPSPGGGAVLDLQSVFREPLSNGGTFLLGVVQPGGEPASFVGTPMVVTVRVDRRRGSPTGPLVYRVEPLRYAVVSTTAGELRVCFYYDTAPNTVASLQRLMELGFYDGLEFFRVEPGFVLQTGDPRNDGTGGPGFMLDAEFSDRQHLEGVLSLARMTDPNEAPGLLPRSEFANSGGSQFFVCLDYKSTRQLDRRYTAFARIVDGLEAIRAIAAAPRDTKTQRPNSPVTITGIKLVPVTPGDNPYARLRVVETATGSELAPATRPGQ